MAIAWETGASSSVILSVGSTTVAYDCGSTANRFLLVDIARYTGGYAAATGITYAGVSMSYISAASANDGNVLAFDVWGLIAPATGSNNIVVTWDGAGLTAALILRACASGVDQTTPYTGAVSDSDHNSSATSITVTSATNDMIVGFTIAAGDQVTSAPTIGSSQTSRSAMGITVPQNVWGSIGSRAGAASAAITWTIASSTWGTGGLNLKLASGAAPPYTGAASEQVGRIGSMRTISGGRRGPQMTRDELKFWAERRYTQRRLLEKLRAA